VASHPEFRKSATAGIKELSTTFSVP